jgi:predicted TIM-barrel fold metal-dependent hydrolase
MDKKKQQPPDRNPRKPKLTLPRGACDCHFHILGPQAFYPMHPDRAGEFEDATMDDWLKMQNALGLSRGLLVQTFMHGYSHDTLLHVLASHPGRLRGVAMPAPDVTDRELEIFTRAGVVGARFGYRINPKIDERLVRRVHEFGWAPHYLFNGDEAAAAWRTPMLASPGNFVVEHNGYPNPARGLDQPCWRVLLDLIDTGRCWVKLSPRPSQQKVLPFDDMLPFIHQLVERAPERLLWGSDWPHPNYVNPMPNDADLIDLMADWVPDAATRKRILVDNPAQLFGFPLL